MSVTMTKFFAGVLSVIAAGVLLIAYGLLSERTSAFEATVVPTAVEPLAASVAQRPNPLVTPAATPTIQVVAPGPSPVAAPVASAPVTRTRVVERSEKRDWKKTALTIGGSTAAGAGLGGAFGGKKGALIGAAIGGGASTLYESTKR